VLKIDPRIQATRKCGLVMSWLDLTINLRATETQQFHILNGVETP